MALTGPADTALGPPQRLVEGVEHLARAFPDLDGLALLGERAALMGLWRRGSASCGGSCRLLPCADGVLAVSLPRAADVEMVPAWLEIEPDPGPDHHRHGTPDAAASPALWSTVAKGVRHRPAQVLTERASLLGLPVTRVGEAGGPGARAPVVQTYLGDAPPRPSAADLLVVDLSALWAGPLCGDLLAGAGAAVVKVESTQRPDGARRGARAFYDLLNGRKRSVALDLRSPQGMRTLRALVRRADVVLESSRPRALAQFGIDAEAVTAGTPDDRGPQVWVSITGYGRAGAHANRVAFGDDAAAAGGLVSWIDDQPFFCADAVADPLTGLTAAAGCLDALRAGGRWLLDVSMAAVSADLAGPTLPSGAGQPVAAPRARPVLARAPDLGADTAQVLGELGLDSPSAVRSPPTTSRS